MTRADFAYRKLPGARHGIFTGSSLWLGNDHLLYVKNTRFAEEYRRYYLNDIEAIYLEKRARFLPPPVVIIGVLLGLVAQVIFQVKRMPVALELGWLMLLAASGYAAWLCLFRSCLCSIQTALGTQRLSCLHRVTGSLAAIAQITDRVTVAQGPALEYQQEPDLPQPNGVVLTAPSRETLFGWLALPFVFISAVLVMNLRVPILGRSFVETLGTMLGTVLFAVLALIAGRGGGRFRAVQGGLLALILTSGLELYALLLSNTYSQNLSGTRGNPVFSLFPMLASSTHRSSIWLADANMAVALITATLLIHSSPRRSA